MTLRTEAFMVLVKRGDGRLPDPVKMSYSDGEQGLHFIIEEAQLACDILNENTPYQHPRSYGVFRVEVEVMEELK